MNCLATASGTSTIRSNIVLNTSQMIKGISRERQLRSKEFELKEYRYKNLRKRIIYGYLIQIALVRRKLKKKTKRSFVNQAMEFISTKL